MLLLKLPAGRCRRRSCSARCRSLLALGLAGLGVERPRRATTSASSARGRSARASGSRCACSRCRRRSSRSPRSRAIGRRCARSRRRCCARATAEERAGARDARRAARRPLAEHRLLAARARDLRRRRAAARSSCPAPGSGRTWTAVEHEGARVAAIVHDAELDATPELVHAAASAAALAIDNERLKAELRARRGGAARTRACGIVEAADDARRRIERDLHDGAQQQLVSLALDLRMLQARGSGTAGGRGDRRRAGDKLDVALAELRELARGIHPAFLSERGLGAGGRGAGRARLDRRMRSSRSTSACRAPVEAAAYFVVAEGLTNVVQLRRTRQRAACERPARAARSSRSRSPTTASAARPIDAGTGLRGLSDRLAVLDGRADGRQPARRGHAAGARGSRRGGRSEMRRALLLLIALARWRAAAARRTCSSPTSSSAATRPSGARQTPAATPERGRGLRIASARIAVVTHGQASDPFWAIVKKGVDDAARKTGVATSYRAPDTYDIERMSEHDRRGGQRPARRARGLAARRGGARAGDQARRAGRDPGRDDQLRQRPVPQARRARPRRAARVQGRRGAPASGSRARACDTRCASTRSSATPGWRSAAAGIETAMKRVGGTLRELGVDVQDATDARRKIAAAVSGGSVDGMMTLGPGGAEPALTALSASGLDRRIKLATFDLSPEVLAAVRDEQDAVRRRPAAVPAGLPAGHAARRALQPPAVPGQGRADPDRSRKCRRTSPIIVGTANARKLELLSGSNRFTAFKSPRRATWVRSSRFSPRRS